LFLAADGLAGTWGGRAQFSSIFSAFFHCQARQMLPQYSRKAICQLEDCG